MRTKLFFVFLLTILLTVFSSGAFAADSGKTGTSRTQAKQLLKALPKTAALSLCPDGQGKISGRVTDRQNNPLVGIEVTAYPKFNNTNIYCNTCISGSSKTITDENGDYIIIGLVGGLYTVEFSQDPSSLMPGEPTHVTQWYNNKIDESLAQTVQVTEPDTTTGINAALDVGGSISGTVTCTSTAKRASFNISVSGATTGYYASTSASYSEPLFPGMPGDDGSYNLAGLPSDTYTVSFSNSSASTDPYGLTPAPLCIDKDFPTQVTVTAPNDTPNINATLALGGTITGKVVERVNGSDVPILNAMVSAVAPGSVVTYIGEYWDSSDQTGTFLISGLPSGTYDVIINGRMAYDMSNPSTPVPKGYILQRVNNVAVTAPNTNDLGTRTLQPGGKITGTVTSSIDGKAIKDVVAIGYTLAGDVVNSALTNSDGFYTLTGFDTGSDKVQFLACQETYAEQWYDKKTTQASADPVVVTAPDTTPNINGVLDLKGTSDTTPPVTSASPSGGTYLVPQTVTLTANEPATIYYTTNGTEPTTASPVYTNPLSIAISAVLKYFAKDTAGNSEAVKSQSYVITPVVNGACGSANGTTVPSAPTTNLCSAGTESVVSGSGPWTWSCNGSNGGTNASCSAAKADTTPPVTTASPTGGTYLVPQTVTLTANEPATIYYTTNGTEPTTASPVYTSPLSIAISAVLKYFAIDTAGNSEAVKSQSYAITPVVNGACGSSNGGTFATAPTSGLCSAGNASTVTESSTWNWSCQGSNGGTTATCAANKSVVTTKPGDCDNNGTVTIAEVQSAINMFLGINQVLLCVDTNNGGTVSIDEVQKTINGFLGL